jgi:hypothetical protein
MLKHFHHPNGSSSPRSKQIISDPHFQQKPNLDIIQKRGVKNTHTVLSCITIFAFENLVLIFAADDVLHIYLLLVPSSPTKCPP